MNPEEVARELLQGIPAQLASLRDEALQFVMQDVCGAPFPVVTSVFWSDLKTSGVTACEPWRDALEHGARIFQTYFDEPNTALSLWAPDYGLDVNEVTLTRALFGRRLVKVGRMYLVDEEIRLLRERSATEKSWEACLALLNEINIILP